MTTFRADLHCHSIFSDGSLDPKELVELAKEKDLQGLSITDHDTLEGYSEELFAFSKQRGVSLLPGVEISSGFEGRNIHILGYGVDWRDQEFSSFLQEIQTRREKRNRLILEKLSQEGIVITEKELSSFGKHVVGRPHIAQVLKEKGVVTTFQEAFELYLKDDARCYVEGEKFSVKEVIEQIHRVNGKAILAHPHFLPVGLSQSLLEESFDGVEGYYGLLFPHQEKRWVEMATSKGLLITGGSDFHGLIKPHIPLGCSWVGEETFIKLGGKID